MTIRAIGGAAAGIGGVLASHYFGYVSPQLGGSLLIFAFIVTVIGGLQTDSEPHQNSRWAAAWRAPRRSPGPSLARHRPYGNRLVAAKVALTRTSPVAVALSRSISASKSSKQSSRPWMSPIA